MNNDEHEIEYTDSFVGALELAWGDGFLSPGGEEEIALFLEGLDIEGKDVLDIGSGTGGCDVVLVDTYGAGHVLGIDIEQPVIDRSIERVEKLGLSNRITYRKVSPGLLPFDDESYDVVFSKDALIHIEDKGQLFSEVFRVLKPGGFFVASDWMCRDDQPPGPEMVAYLKIVGLTFGLKSPPHYIQALEAAGFQDIETRDRNLFLVDALRSDFQLLSGNGRDELVKRTGPEAQHFIDVWSAAYKAAESGELLPNHIRGFKLDS